MAALRLRLRILGAIAVVAATTAAASATPHRLTRAQLANAAASKAQLRASLEEQHAAAAVSAPAALGAGGSAASAAAL